MKRGLLAILLVLSGLAFSCATQALTSPTNVGIVPPASHVPPEYSAILGKWGGRWYKQDDKSVLGVYAVLMVEEIIDTTQASIVYSWYTLDGGSFSKRGKAELSKNEHWVSISFSSPVSAANYKFRMINAETIKGVSGPYGALLSTYVVTMTRIE